MSGQVGGISIHVVDVSRGVIASGMRVEVYTTTPGRRCLVSGSINAKGVLDDPVLMSEAMQAGYYEAVFHVADYYRKLGVPQTNPEFLDVVPIRVAIYDAGQRYHVPLYFSPWGFMTYRGS